MGTISPQKYEISFIKTVCMTLNLEWYLSQEEIYIWPGDFHKSKEGMMGFENLILYLPTSYFTTVF